MGIETYYIAFFSIIYAYFPSKVGVGKGEVGIWGHNLY